MENLTHSLTGAVLARTGLDRKVPYGTAALVIAANLPDIDSIVTFWGTLVYFKYHRGITHSIPGVAVLGLLYAALLWALNRRRKKPLPVTFPAILKSILLVTATHPLMDFTNSYGWRPFLPFLDRWYYGDLVFIVDCYLWLLLGGALFLTARRSAWSRPFWMAGVLFLCYLVFAQQRMQPGLHLLSLVCIGALAGLALLKRARTVWVRSTLYWALSGVLLYWGLLFGVRQYGLAFLYPDIERRYPHIARTQISALPRFADPFSWDVVFTDPGNIYHGIFSLSRGINAGFRSYPRNLDHPAVKAALASCPGSVMAHFARFEFFEVQEGIEGPVVILRDARYAREARSGFGVLSIPLTPDLKTHSLKLPCPGDR